MREQEIWEQFPKEIEERKERAKQLITEMHQKKGKKYKSDFGEVLVQAFTKFVEYQQTDVEKKMKYVQVNCLRVSLETATYKYLVRIMDEYGYQDKKMAEVYYVPQYLPELIDADKEYFTKLLMSKVIRTKKYEVKDFLRKYFWDTFLKPIPPEISDVISKVNELEIYNQIEKASDVEVGYGEMLELYDEFWLFISRKE